MNNVLSKSVMLDLELVFTFTLEITFWEKYSKFPSVVFLLSCCLLPSSISSPQESYLIKGETVMKGISNRRDQGGMAKWGRILVVGLKVIVEIRGSWDRSEKKEEMKVQSQEQWWHLRNYKKSEIFIVE